jgi:hypothetical protein
MEDNLIVLEIEDDLNFFGNGILPQFFLNEKLSQYLDNGRRPEIFSKIGSTANPSP